MPIGAIQSLDLSRSTHVCGHMQDLLESIGFEPNTKAFDVFDTGVLGCLKNDDIVPVY
jgi:hypothetical protein